MDRNLFLSILALDSYNRGYGERLRITPSGGTDVGKHLGLAQINQQSDVETGQPGVQAGFYAIAYDWNGEKIISYRGTDDLLRDAVTGTGVGATCH